MTRVLSIMIILADLFIVCRHVMASDAPVIERGSHVLILDGVIGGRNLMPLGEQLIHLAEKEDNPEVSLIINSPGGEVVAGFLFLNMMDQARASGATIRCFVPGLAASMAFQILVHCDERYVLSKSFLLWHRARVFSMGTLTAPQARELADGLQSLDSTILSETTRAMPNTPPEVVEHHFEVETLHLGILLCSNTSPGFCKSYDHIEGLFEALLGDRETGKKADELFDRTVAPPATGFTEGSPIYIQPGYVLPGNSAVPAGVRK